MASFPGRSGGYLLPRMAILINLWARVIAPAA